MPRSFHRVQWRPRTGAFTEKVSATVRASIHYSEGKPEMKDELTLEQQRNILAAGLSRICTAGSLVPGDPLDDAYREAGGGYGGLQEIAVKTLEMAGRPRQGTET